MNVKFYLQSDRDILEEILEVYKQANGAPDPKPEIDCPLCSKKTKNYSCLWYGNKHVGFYFDHCDLMLRQ